MDANHFSRQLLLLFAFVVKLGTFIGFAIQNDIFFLLHFFGITLIT